MHGGMFPSGHVLSADLVGESTPGGDGTIQTSFTSQQHHVQGERVADDREVSKHQPTMQWALHRNFEEG